MEDLEDQAAMMAWDWDADEINADKEDRKQLIPMTPQTMRHLETPRPGQFGLFL